LVGLQLGLRQRRLRAQLKATTPEIAGVVRDVLVKFQEIVGHPNIVALFLRSACLHLEEIAAREQSANTAGVLGEMWEMSFLLETSTRFYLK
jgi:hypothetical protein